MLVNLKQIIDMAERGNFCVPAFNVYNMETVMGVLKAAEEAKDAVEEKVEEIKEAVEDATDDIPTIES